MQLRILGVALALVACGKDDAKPAPAKPRDAARAAAVAPDAAAKPPAIPAPALATPCLSFQECTASCDRDVGEDCDRLAAFYLHGWGVTTDLERTRELGGRACELGYAIACPLEPAVVARRIALLDAGCQAGRADHCTGLGYTLRLPKLELSPDALAEADIAVLRRAEAALERGCELGDPFGCQMVAISPTRAFSAHADDRDYTTLVATRLHDASRKACADGDAHWCRELGEQGEFQSDGAPLEPDPKARGRFLARAHQLFADECMRGYPESCAPAKVLTEDRAEQQKLRRQACSLGVKDNCP